MQHVETETEGRVNMGLERSRDDVMIGGVCAGIAEQYDFDPTVVRLLYVLISIFSAAFPGILVYILLWIIMPQKP